MDEKEKTAQPVPYVVFEGEMTRRERTERRLWVIIVILILALVGSNAGWIYRETQFADEVVTVTQDNADGYNNFIGNDGDIINGKTDNHD